MIELSGKVLHGRGYGKILGFPTANIDRRQYVRLTDTAQRKIRFGIYAGIVELSSGKRHKAGIVIGPKDGKGLPYLEAYLLGFKGNLYGRRLVFQLHKYLRSYKKFFNEQTLKSQIQKDVTQIKKLKSSIKN